MNVKENYCSGGLCMSSPYASKLDRESVVLREYSVNTYRSALISSRVVVLMLEVSGNSST